MLDDLFRTAVAAIDAGDVAHVEHLLIEHPSLVRDRLVAPGTWLRDTVGQSLDSFFKDPYLLWFVAEDPVRNGKLPPAIAGVARAIVEAARRETVESLQEQLDYALRLVAWSWIARDCHVQIALIDVLVEAGASLDGTPDDALVNGNFEAAAHLVDRGATLTLSTALCLQRWDEAARLAPLATSSQKQLAFVLAALKGKADAVARAIEFGVDLNAPSAQLYSHATALHHAVSSGSLDAVKVLVEAGAALQTKDTVYDGTPLEWAEYMNRAEIAEYLRGRV
jgi:peptide-methionine (S)-S-oxide reductase